MSSFRLVLANPDSTVPISLDGTRWLVGRDAGSDIHLNDPMVSRRHALLYLDQDTLWIRDLGARNPVLVNDEECQHERQLAPGDRITIGSTVAEVHATHELRACIVHGEGSTYDDADTLVLRELMTVDTDASLRILNSLADSLAPVQAAADASLLALELIMKELPLRRGFVARIGTRDSLKVIASVDQTGGAESPTVRISRGILSLLRREKATVCLTPVGEDSTEPSCLLSPLLTRGSLRGMVYLEHDGQSDACAPRELDLAACLTRILASRLETLDVLEQLRQENIHLKQGERSSACFLGLSDPAQELRSQAELLAGRSHPILVLGEAGCGKETIARQIHGLSTQRQPSRLRPFVVLDASPSADSNFAEELFGSAERAVLRQGKLCAAHGGTLCIRHIEGLPHELQEQLVRDLASAQIEVDGTSSNLSARLMLTSTLPLDELIDGGRLATTLAHLTRDTTLQVPPLRDRLEDLPILAAHFLDELARETEGRAAQVSPRAMDRLRSYEWPGNVAEFRQVLTNAGILARGNAIYPKQLPRKLGTTSGRNARPTNLPTLCEMEKRHIEYVLESVGGNKVMAASVLGIANSTLYQKMKRYKI